MKKWVKALRSDKFKQGAGTLKQFNSKGQAQHCCLGVLCELYNEHMRKNKKKILREKIRNNDIGFSFVLFDDRRDDLPNEVMIWSGINDSFGNFNGYCLSDMNDLGQKFKTIADIIEKNWESL